MCVCSCALVCALCWHSRGTAATCGIYSSARSVAGGHPCVVALDAIGRARASAAGITWTSRTLKAEWAARGFHTSVIDAAGAIYVLGGFARYVGGTHQDVWVSTDGGA